MKKLSLLLILCFSLQLLSAQNFRKPYREAKRALKKKDFVTATLKSIESLNAKNNFKKSNDIFEKALSQVNNWGKTYIQKLEAKAIPYKDYLSVAPMKEVCITYSKLYTIQNKLFELSDRLSSKQKKFIALHNFDYEKTRNKSDSLLNAYNNNAADEFFNKGLQAFKNAANKYDYKETYKTLSRSIKYVKNYKETELYMNRSLKLGTLNIGYFPIRNLTNTPYDKIATINMVNSTISLFGKYPFANYTDIRNKIELRNMGALGEKGKDQLKNIDEFVKFKFLKYYAGPTVVSSKVFYSNKKEKKKKNGTVKTWYCQGYIYEVRAVGTVEVEVDFLDNNGDLLDSRQVLVNVEHDDKFFLATKESDRRAYPLLKKFTRTMPEPFDVTNALTNRFNYKINEVFKRYE